MTSREYRQRKLSDHVHISCDEWRPMDLTFDLVPIILSRHGNMTSNHGNIASFPLSESLRQICLLQVFYKSSFLSRTPPFFIYKTCQRYSIKHYTCLREVLVIS